MVLLMCFVVVNDSVHDTRDERNECDKNNRSSFYDDPGKSFLIFLNYKNCT